MKILEVKNLALEGAKVIRFARFKDERGYFSEIYNSNDFSQNPQLDFLKGLNIVQQNESFSKAGTIRGLHFQWDPSLSKMVRVINGRMLDAALDIKKNSPTFGKIILYELKSDPTEEYAEWVWLPAGFAHGMFILEDTRVEYLCDSSYNSKAEASINPLAEDLDWSLCDKKLQDEFVKLTTGQVLISQKDKNGFSFADWTKDSRSENFKI